MLYIEDDFIDDIGFFQEDPEGWLWVLLLVVIGFIIVNSL